MSGCVCDGGRGKGERLHGSHEDHRSMCAVEVAGVCVCACAWPKWGANMVILEKGNPTWETLSSLAGSKVVFLLISIHSPYVM